MKPHPRFSRACALVILTAAFALPPSFPAASAAPGESFLAGRTAGAGGRLRSADLTVYAYPTSADAKGMMRGVLVAKGRTSANGDFELSLLRSDLAPYTFEDGTMMVQVVGQSGGATVNMTFNAKRDARGAWHNPDSGRSLASIELRTEKQTGVDRRDAVGGKAGTSSAQTQAAVSPAATCSGGYGWGMTSNARYAYVPLQAYKTLSNANLLYSWQTTKSTKLEVLARNSTTGAVSATGTLAFSSQNTTAAGIDATWGYNVNRRLLAEWEYREWKEYCFLINNVTQETGRTEWRPYRFAGGNYLSATTQDFTCTSTNRSTFGNSTWVSQTATTTWSGGFSIYGVGLMASTTNSATAKLTVKPRTGANATLCGNNAKPLYAQRVKEV